MTRITLLFSCLFIGIATANAQVIETFFNPDPSSGLIDGSSNWADTGVVSFPEFLDTRQAGNARVTTPNGATPAVMSYTGVFNGTVTSTGNFVIDWRHAGFSGGTMGDLTQLNIMFEENGLPRTLTIPVPAIDSNFEVSSISGGFAEGATLSNLSLTFTTATGESTFDTIRLRSFVINSSDPALSIATVNEIPGASITTKNGIIIANGANIDAVYALTGQQVGAIGLPAGIYMIRVSKRDLKTTLKVVVN